MFDKITIRAKISDDECAHLAHIHHLQSWVNEAGTQVRYQSSEYSNRTGIEVKIIRNKITLRTSLHKFWNNRNFGLLRNDNIFTISEAKSAFEMLLFENGLIPGKTRIVQFELGLNMQVSCDPLKFIELVRGVSARDRIMFIDANYVINRQKTTEKHKNIRRYFKIYDKGWEMMDKRRKPPEIGREMPHILRIETVYKRHDERADTFFTNSNIERLVQVFNADWSSLFFHRSVRAYKGARKSEVERAIDIVNIGAETYMERVRRDLEEGKITQKQFRTIREFVRDYQKNKDRFKTVISPQEREYKRLFLNVFNETRK